MVEVLRAALLVPVHATVVKLEALVAGINSDADGALNLEEFRYKKTIHAFTHLSGESRLESILIPGLDVDKPDVSGASVSGVVAALVVLALVGVALLSVDTTILLDVLEGKVHQTSITTLVISILE